MTSTRRINWTNTLFLTLTPLFAITSTIFIIASGHLQIATVILAVLLMGATGLAITAGYHRLFSHRTYRTVWPIRLMYLLMGAASFEGSALEWSTDHRKHHLYVDTNKDPYNINQGFWHAHIGWLIFLDTSKRDFKNVKDLSDDPLVLWQHRFFVPIAIVMGFILPAVIASFWGDFWGGFIIAGALRIVLNQHLTFCINSVCHMFGKREYSEQQSARDNWVTALFTYGEGFHNFHHQFMFDYRNGIRFYHFDPAKWLIFALASMKLAYDLKRVCPKQIIRYTVRVDENHARLQIKQYSETLAQHAERFIQPLREAVLQAANRLDQLEEAYSQLKKQKLEDLKEKVADYQALLKAQKSQLKLARSELAVALARWHRFLKHPTSLATQLN
jgi:stearoyl-CoA desaturase (delta-9 desaturase)